MLQEYKNQNIKDTKLFIFADGKMSKRLNNGRKSTEFVGNGSGQ